VSRVTRPSGRVLLAAVVLLLAARGGSPAAQSPAPTAQATCVFSNPAFAGKCIEKAPVAQGATPAQACESILQCLNNVDCLKTYCQATTVRTGWKLESAK
jgi:hypothetical protein